MSLLCALCLASCAKPSSKASSPSSVSGHVAESDLVTVTLTPEAESRLGIELTKLKNRTIAQTRTIGGDVIAPEGASDFSRYASTTMDATQLAAAQVNADAAVTKARAVLDAARKQRARIETLVRSKSESQRALDDATVSLRSAEADLGAAEGQRHLLGQALSGNAPERVWIRAPIYVGDVANLDLDAPAQASPLAGQASRLARKAALPSTASSQSATVNLFYEADNADGALRMGERVNLEIPTRATTEGLVVPYSAVLYDINGGEWIYVRKAEHVFARQRVMIRAIVGDDALIADGPTPGADVVATGAPELFGTEFGVAH